MEDKQIVDLYWERSESAITETEQKYGRYCYSIAFRILCNEEDSEECVNDTYLRAWNAMPSHRPNMLSTFLGKITRNISINRYERYSAKKRGLGQIPLVLEELENCLPSNIKVEQAIEETVLVEVLNRFLSSLKAEKRKIFMQRYWYLSSIKEIAEEYRISASKVKMVLFRLRNDLKLLLEKEGVVL